MREVPARHGDVPSFFVRDKKEDDLKIPHRLPKSTPFVWKNLLCGTKDTRVETQEDLYGLIHLGRLWNMMLHEILMSLGFGQCYTYIFVHIKTETDGRTLVGICVDDVLATGTTVKKIGNF